MEELLNFKLNNVISFEKWKSALAETKSERSLQDYLKVLSFHDLVNEYKDVLSDLDREPLNQEITKRTKSILIEFSNRLGEHSSEHSDSLGVLRKKIERKIFDLNGLL